MTYREKLAWIQLLLQTPFWGLAAWLFGTTISGGPAPSLPLLGVLLLLPAASWLLTFVVRHFTREADRERRDEREEQIDMRSRRIGMWAMTFANLALVLGLIFFAPQARALLEAEPERVVLYTLLLLNAFGATVVAAMQVALFRRHF